MRISNLRKSAWRQESEIVGTPIALPIQVISSLLNSMVELYSQYIIKLYNYRWVNNCYTTLKNKRKQRNVFTQITPMSDGINKINKSKYTDAFKYKICLKSNLNIVQAVHEYASHGF